MSIAIQTVSHISLVIFQLVALSFNVLRQPSDSFIRLLPSPIPVSASPHRLVCLHQQPACPSSPALESWSWQPVEASHALTCLPLNEEMSGNWGRQTRHSAGTVWHTVQLATYIANSTDDCPREDDRRWGWLPSKRMDCLYKVDKVLSILIFSP